MAVDVFSSHLWNEILGRADGWASDPDVRDQILSRWLNKYLKAVMRAQSQEWEDRAWLALYNYLIYPISPRKPFSLSPHEADDLVAALQEQVRALKE